MKFEARDYFQASVERLSQAELLFRSGSYALSMYSGGLAVESMLRAFRWIEDDSFEGRHDMMELLKESRLLSINESAQRGRLSVEAIDRSTSELRDAINIAATLWHNNLRYASEARCLAHLRQINRARGFRGDPLRKNARDLQFRNIHSGPWSRPMGVREKVFETLKRAFPVEFIHLTDDDGIIGFVISSRFDQMSALDRRHLVKQVLAKGLSPAERREVVIVAPLTSDEWGAMGLPISIPRVIQFDSKTVSVVVAGTPRDAEFVRQLLGDELDMKTSEAMAVPSAEGALMSFSIQSAKNPTLSKCQVVEVLRTKDALEVDSTVC